VGTSSFGPRPRPEIGCLAAANMTGWMRAHGRESSVLTTTPPDHTQSRPTVQSAVLYHHHHHHRRRRLVKTARINIRPGVGRSVDRRPHGSSPRQVHEGRFTPSLSSANETTRSSAAERPAAGRRAKRNKDEYLGMQQAN